MDFPTPALEKVLGKTLGVPLFQEQAMQVAMVAAGFSPTEADQLRRAMATFKFTGGVNKFQDKLITGMLDNGYTREFAERTFRQLEGFGSYGFPESHAASFALIAYASSWMKCHHPDVFLAAILNAQPMGFYAPAQLVRDAREHGVEVRPVDVNLSRMGLHAGAAATDSCMRRAPRLLHGARPRQRRTASGSSPRCAPTRRYSHRSKISGAAPACRWRRCTASRRRTASGPWPVAARSRLGDQGACATRPCRSSPRPMIATAQLRPEAIEPAVTLPPMTMGREVVEDYRSKGLSLRAHPVAFLRESLAAARLSRPAPRFATAPNGRRISIAGLVLVRQMPGSAKGVMFITLGRRKRQRQPHRLAVGLRKEPPHHPGAPPCWAAGARCSAQAMSFT